MLNGAPVIAMVNNSLGESKRNYGRLIKTRSLLIEKNKDIGSEKYISTGFR